MRVIWNTSSGQGSKFTLWEEVLSQQGIGYSLVSSPEEIEVETQRLLNKNEKTIIAAGGDGTVHQVANHLLTSQAQDVRLGVLPLGTGNNFARKLGLSLNGPETIHQLLAAREERVDVLECSFADRQKHYALNLVASGVSSEVHQDLDPEQKKFWGALSYIHNAAKKLVEGKTFPFRVSINAQDFGERKDLVNLLITNTGLVGSGMVVKKNVSLQSGALDVFLLRDCPLSEIGVMALEVLAGQGFHSEFLESFQTTSINVQSESTVPFSLDGDLYETEKITVKVLPSALTVLVPQETDEI